MQIPCLPILAYADSMFTHILEKYNVEKYGLLLETYPPNPKNQVTYLAEGTEQKRNQEVSFLWPYSGMLSGGIALYRATGDETYREILEKRILQRAALSFRLSQSQIWKRISIPEHSFLQ